MKTIFLGLTPLLIVTMFASAHAQSAPANLTCEICQVNPTPSTCRLQIQSQADQLCRRYGYKRGSSVVMKPVSTVFRRGFCYNNETHAGGSMNVVNMETQFACQ